MATLYQKCMSSIDPTKIVSIYDTVNKSFIPIDDRNPDYQRVLAYLVANNITIYDLDLYTG